MKMKSFDWLEKEQYFVGKDEGAVFVYYKFQDEKTYYSIGIPKERKREPYYNTMPNSLFLPQTAEWFQDLFGRINEQWEMRKKIRVELS